LLRETVTCIIYIVKNGVEEYAVKIPRKQPDTPSHHDLIFSS